MDPGSSELVKVAALGRPFSLGMLYDCRSDQLYPGLTLWDTDVLQKGTRISPQPSTTFEIVASESIDDKTKSLNVEASLKASFLGGFVELGGSAEYLNDSKTSQNQARVTLNYKATTDFRQLSMNTLGSANVTHPEVFHAGIATHVVTGITYGAQAFFVFDHDVSVEEHRKTIEGSLKEVINKIPTITIGGGGSVKLDDKDQKAVDKFSCKFIGDFQLKSNPVNFKDAIETYQSLPELLGPNGENAVPVKVWLMPLQVLDSKAAHLVREISIGLVNDAQIVLEDFSELEQRYNDALKSTVAQQFPQISKKLRDFKDRCNEYKLEFQKTLAKKLPSIRGGGEEESVLADVLKRRHSSPFNNKDLAAWMDCKEREINIIKSLIKMESTKIVSNQNELDQIILSPETEHAVCFAFTSLQTTEPYLSTLSSYLREISKQPTTQDFALHTHDVEKEQWYFSEDYQSMRQKANLFIDFSEANKNRNIQFLTTAIPNESQKGASVYLYKDGDLVNKNFEPPSKPETPAVSDITHNSSTLKMFPPRFGAENTTHYSIEYRVSGQNDWQEQTASKADEVTVSNLTPNTEYMFRFRAVCPVGRGPASETSGSMTTLPTSPPGKPQVEAYSDQLSVKWEKPTELGDGVTVERYNVEYTKVSTGLEHEQLPWTKVTSKAEKVIISGLEPMTEYVVKVRCECGVAGRSKESIAVTVQTAEARLAEFYRRKCTLINSESPSVYKLPLEINKIDIDGCKSYSLGKENNKPFRTIMVLGATGSGKTTLINGMINYILGVRWEDSFRFKLVDDGQTKSQVESQTSEVTLYKINHQEGFQIDSSLNIIDTPGFGDTRGIERDKLITEQLNKLFTNPHGVSEIDAVCFVAQASLVRLTPTQKYVFDSVLSIFGKDILVEENIRVLVTFADFNIPPILEAIKASGVPCPTKQGQPLHFKFNNSALFAGSTAAAAAADDDDDDEDSEDEVGSFNKMYWDMGFKSMKNFFNSLNTMNTKSLTLTKEVLCERKRLEISVDYMENQVKFGIAKTEEIKETTSILKAEITANENFVYEIRVTKPFKTQSNRFNTNCPECRKTCHHRCRVPMHILKYKCSAMEKGECTLCGCKSGEHLNEKYLWEYKEVIEKRTLEDLQKKYRTATKQKMSVEELIAKLEAEYEDIQMEVLRHMESSAKCIERLKEIALKPNPLSTPEYIDQLIEGEKSGGKPGYLDRINSLQSMRKKAVTVTMIKVRDKETVTSSKNVFSRLFTSTNP